jgi:hypothetical protein
MSRDRRATVVKAAFLAAAAAVLHGVAALSGWFEIPSEQVAVDAARTLASTGADASGAALPLFIHVRDTLWLQPIPIYLMALALKLSGDASVGPRLITTVVAAIDVVLTYLVARRVFHRERPAVIAAAVLLLTPAHLVYGSTASTALYSVPFALLWLLAWFGETDDAHGLRRFAATAALGLGVYTNPEAVWTMTAFAAVTIILDALTGRRNITLLASTGGGFMVALLPLVPWFLAHPRSYVDTMGRWGVHLAHVRNPIDGLRTFFGYDPFARHLSLYWDFFSPRHLFFTTQAPALAWAGGVVPWPLVLFLPLGMYALVYREPRTPRTSAIIWGFFAAPVAAAAFDESRVIAGAMTILPFAAILGAAGIQALLDVHWSGTVTASQTPQTPAFR